MPEITCIGMATMGVPNAKLVGRLMHMVNQAEYDAFWREDWTTVEEMWQIKEWLDDVEAHSRDMHKGKGKGKCWLPYERIKGRGKGNNKGDGKGDGKGDDGDKGHGKGVDVAPP